MAATVPYVNVSQFSERTIMPAADVDDLEATEPGRILKLLTMWTAWINGRLAKRYATPFAEPAEIVLLWLTQIVTYEAYNTRGWNPSSQQDAGIERRALAAMEEVKEAANSETGLFDLPLKESAVEASGVSKGGPFGSSEASPYTWTDRQAEAARDER